MSSTRTVTDICNLALDILKEAPIADFDTDNTAVARWMRRNYAEARDAELREHPWRFAIKRKRLTPGAFVLDGITATLTGAWAPFRLTQKWSGNLVTLRRSSDSTTENFTYGDDGITIDLAEIEEFVGTGTGYLRLFFDQSGNGRTLGTATTTRQPEFDDAETESGKPAVSFDGTDDFLETAGNVTNLISTTVGYIVVAGLIDTLTLDSATVQSNHVLIGDSGSRLNIFVRLGGTLYGRNDDGSADNTTDAVLLAKPFVAELRHTDGTLYTRVNAGTEQSTTSGTTSSLANPLNVGSFSGDQALDFKLFAILTFSTIPSEADRNRIVDRLMRWCAAGGAEEFGWDYRYTIPTDSLRILPLTGDGEFEGRPVSHVIEGDYILTGQSTELMVRYIQQFTDTTRFDPLFVEALAARLATKMAHWATGKISMVTIAGAAYNVAVANAKTANALEGTPERPTADDVIDVRYDATGVR